MLKNTTFPESLSATYNAFTHQEYYRMFPQSILHYINENGGLKGKSVFDVGCGNGNLSALLIENGAKNVLGIDISDSQIALAKGKHKMPGLEFRVEDAYKIHIQPEAPFDVVVSMYAFHFIKNKGILEQACRNLYENLKEGGLLVFLDITHDYVYNKQRMEELRALTSYAYYPDVEEGQVPKPWSRIRGEISTEGGKIPIDHMAIHGSEIKRVLETVGFKIVERKPFVFHIKKYVEFWGENGFNHHLLVAKK